MTTEDDYHTCMEAAMTALREMDRKSKSNADYLLLQATIATTYASLATARASLLAAEEIVAAIKEYSR